MRLFDGLSRYFAFKMKELEFRIHTWKRAKEISRAYGNERPAVGFAFKIRFKPVLPKINFGAAVPYMVRGGKILAAIAAMFFLAFGLIRAIPYISASVSASAAAAKDSAGQREPYDVDAMPPPPPEDLPEGTELPETAVLPEGYAGSAYTGTDAETDVQTPQTAQPTSPEKKLADVFKAGMPRGITNEWLLLVDKASKIMYLFRDDPGRGWEITRAYTIATGEREGPKRVEGDKKTPQGEYFIVGRKHRSELTNLYGPAAFITDYPNEIDRAAGRTGHGIWIHGSERGDIEPLFTQGCVAVSNPDILDLASRLRAWAGVPVIIVSGLEEPQNHLAAIDFERLKARGRETVRYHNERQAEFERIVIDWKTAWETKDINAYASFYSTGTFQNGTQRWEDYRAHKLRTFAQYATINIDITDISLTELTENSATVKFNQLYVTNVNRMENAKRLIFRKDQNSWKIHREIPFSKEELLL